MSSINQSMIAKDENWNNWHWQLKNRISDIKELKKIVNLSKENELKIKKAIDIFPMAITPYYASLMDSDNLKCPIRMQSIPSIEELHTSDYDMDDPLHEDKDSPAPGLTIVILIEFFY